LDLISPGVLDRRLSTPFSPRLEYDAEALARTIAEMHANTVRTCTMGKYATIQGVRFCKNPQLGARAVLAETIAACKPRGIRTVAYYMRTPTGLPTVTEIISVTKRIPS
jgi:hypothetical protein